MKTIIAALFALGTTTGLAFAQGEGEAPQLIGDLGPSVHSQYNEDTRINTGKRFTRFSARDRSERRDQRDRRGRIAIEVYSPDRYTGR